MICLKLQHLGRPGLPQLVPSESCGSESKHRRPAGGHQAPPEQYLDAPLLELPLPLSIAAGLGKFQLERREIEIVGLTKTLKQIKIRWPPETPIGHT